MIRLFMVKKKSAFLFGVVLQKIALFSHTSKSFVFTSEDFSLASIYPKSTIKHLDVNTMTDLVVALTQTGVLLKCFTAVLPKKVEPNHTDTTRLDAMGKIERKLCCVSPNINNFYLIQPQM